METTSWKYTWAKAIALINTPGKYILCQVIKNLKERMKNKEFLKMEAESNITKLKKDKKSDP